MDRNAECWRVRAGLGVHCHSLGGCALLLTLPDIRQTNGHDCGEAAIRCVLGFHGITASVKIASPIDGTDPRAIETFLRDRIGLNTASGSMDAADLKHFCDTGRPVICLVTNPGEGSHWVTCRGVSRGRVYVMDPWDGPQVYSGADWESLWTATGRLGEVYRRWGVVVSVPSRQ